MIVDASIMIKPTTPFGIAINAGCFAAFTTDGACTCQDPCMLHAAAGVQAAQAGSFVLEKCKYYSLLSLHTPQPAAAGLHCTAAAAWLG
jgi:hypothetical protein